MRKLFATLTMVAFAAVVGSPAAAHIGTERYIPIGMSPGISGQHSYIGTITAYEAESHSLVMDSERGGDSMVQMNEHTRIYLDRSQAGKTNLRGSYEDCRPGRRIEVKFRNNDPSQPAEWIKVQLAE